MRFLLGVSLLLLAFPSLADAPELKIFRSKASLQKSLGPKISKQIPSYFNFKTHALVFFEQEKHPTARVVIHDSERHPGLQDTIQLRSNIRVSVAEVDRKLLLTVTTNPYECVSPVARPHEEQIANSNQCAANHKRTNDRIHKTAFLIAVRQKSLKRLKIVEHKMQPPPSAPPRPR